MPILCSRYTPTRSLRAVRNLPGTGPAALSLAALALGGALGGCTADGPDQQAPATTVTVLAAASLTDVFADLDEVTPALTATFSFGSSTALAEQAAVGAPGDVLATADRTAMDLALSTQAVTADPVEFATNRLVLVVPADNPAGISSLADLAGSDWVRCADDVPCGRLAVKVLASPQNAAAIGAAEPVSLEADVRSVLARVRAGEADAGLVYATDAVEAGDEVRVIELPGADTQPTSYWIAPLADGNQAAATEWIAAVTSDTGRHLLDEAGFDRP